LSFDTIGSTIELEVLVLLAKEVSVEQKKGGPMKEATRLHRTVLFLLSMLIVMSMGATEVSPMVKTDYSAMISKYEDLFDEFMCKHDQRKYTYASCLEGNEKKLELSPDSYPISVTYYSKGRKKRIDIEFFLPDGSSDELRTHILNGERVVSWNRASQKDIGEYTFAAFSEGTESYFEDEIFQPFRFRCREKGAQLQFKEKGPNILLQWKDSDSHWYEITYERHGAYLRPILFQSLYARKDEPHFLGFELTYYYENKDALYPTKVIERAPGHQFINYRYIKKVDLSPSLREDLFNIFTTMAP
jgi:hypothetical protein